MRVFLDTNIFISYLLEASDDSPINQCIEQAIVGSYTLLIVQQLLDEFIRRTSTKPYLAHRIPQNKLQVFIQDIVSFGEMVPPITTAIPSVTRDAKDDYLIAYAIVGQADYLVTGDDDLLVIGTVDTLQIVTPRQFVTLLEASQQ